MFRIVVYWFSEFESHNIILISTRHKFFDMWSRYFPTMSEIHSLAPRSTLQSTVTTKGLMFNVKQKAFTCLVENCPSHQIDVRQFSRFKSCLASEFQQCTELSTNISAMYPVEHEYFSNVPSWVRVFQQCT